MVESTDSIVVKRLVRNLRYRLTYIRIFESFLKCELDPEVVLLLHALIDAQESIVAPLTAYLQNLGVEAQGLRVVRKLADHASSRKDVRSQLRFIRFGLTKAVSWYKAQLVDKQMTADPELRNLLLQLGELEAASLWRTRAVMGMMGLSEEHAPRRSTDHSRGELAPGRQVRRRHSSPSRRTVRRSRQPGRWATRTDPRHAR